MGPEIDVRLAMSADLPAMVALKHDAGLAARRHIYDRAQFVTFGR